MPKVLFKFKQKKRMQLTVLMLLFLTSFYGQNKVVIAYGEKINLGKVSKNVHFYFSTAADKIHLRGNEINNYVFSIPGIYNLKVEEKHARQNEECTDIHLPGTFQVEVSRVKMRFDEKNLVLSAPIFKNKSTNETTLTIPVSIQTFDHLPAILNKTAVKTAGIGTNIIATLDPNAKELPEGKHILQYHLNGLATENTYLMFDFVDANGKIQTVPLLTPVKN